MRGSIRLSRAESHRGQRLAVFRSANETFYDKSSRISTLYLYVCMYVCICM
jgi:hypothetical protein